MKRPHQEWKEVELAQVLGMASNPVNPSVKYAKRLLNLQAHEKPGALKLRPGYSLKYGKPTHDNIQNLGFLNFGLFTDRVADINGVEVTVLIQKGEIQPVTGSGIDDTFNMLCFWIRPYWDGTEWKDEWKWLNETYVTKITTGSNILYDNMIKTFGGDNQGYETGQYNKFTIYNQTKNQYAKIITSVIDSPGNSYMRINHSLYNSTWDIDDVVIIGKNWVDKDYMAGLFTADWKEVVFHRVNNDLRIGFGGYENRIGLAVGYRKKYYSISEVDFTNLHSDITSNAIDAFATTDEVVLDTHILNTELLLPKSAYGFGGSMSFVSGSLTGSNHYIRMTGFIDGFQEQLVNELHIPSPILSYNIQPQIRLGLENPRITHFKFYYSTDGITYFSASDKIPVTSDSIVDRNWKITEYGLLQYENVELHIDNNAASLSPNETNSIGNWTNTSFFTLASVNTDSPPNGSYSLLATYASPHSVDDLLLTSPVSSSVLKTVTVSFYAKIGASVSGVILHVMSYNGSSYNTVTRPLTNSWVQHTFTMEIKDRIIFYIPNCPSSVLTFSIDGLSVESPAIEILTAPTTNEMSNVIGYNPTFNYVKSWDQALKYKGRIFYLNPYVDKRYENFLLMSHFHSSRAYMYDLSTFGSYHELERDDSSKAIGMTILPTTQFLILKDKSVEAIDPDTGAAVDPVYGVSCISRESIVNMNGLIFWCGLEDVYKLSSTTGITPLLKDTIRDRYLEIAGKYAIVAIRDKYNCYRFRVYSADDRTEFLLTETGWKEGKKALLAEVYRASQSHQLCFLAAGNIYAVDTTLDYTAPDEILMTDEAITDES